MTDMLSQFIANVAMLRQKVIESGGRPTTLKISQTAIERIKLFGMNIEVVHPTVLPKGVDMIVYDDKDMY